MPPAPSVFAPRIITREDPPGPEAIFVTLTPATLPASALAVLISRAWVKFSPPTVVAENCSDFLFLSTPSAVTITSLNSAVETFSVREMLVFPLIETSFGAKPMDEMVSRSTLDGTVMPAMPATVGALPHGF